MPDLPEDRLAALRGGEPERPTLPASEVRRRGDRHRRTRTAASVAAAALVVAVVAGGVSALTPSDGQSAPDPVDAPTPSVTESPVPATIPDDVPLDAGLPAENLDGTPVEVTDEPGVRSIGACGETILGAEGAVDVAGAAYEGGEDSRYRTLLLLESESAARDLVDRAADVVAGCPRQEVQGSTELFESLESTLGAGSIAFMTRFENAGSALTNPTTYHLVPVGNAVLITSGGGEAGNTPDGLASAADFAAAGAAAVLAALVGDAGPSGTATPAAAPVPPPDSTEIPAGLPLDAGPTLAQRWPNAC